MRPQQPQRLVLRVALVAGCTALVGPRVDRTHERTNGVAPETRCCQGR